MNYSLGICGYRCYPSVLVAERHRGYRAETTADCRFDACPGCGVCPGLKVDNLLVGGATGGDHQN